VVLGGGIVSTLLTFGIPPYARLFLTAARAEGETRQAAQALFLEHELFRTGTRTGVLMLVCMFERRVVVLADRGLRARLPAGAADAVIAAMTTPLRASDWSGAFAAGIDKLEAAIQSAGLAGGARDSSLPDHLDTHRGEGDSC